ncbi:hypothetical protein [Aquimarina agarivorans]|uniref:hypothetical protein n=1 Tax=Aquimarina agarivorans TaxID=980584 RepID=UPI000497270A|nr:hypothetical protein [Aquimarina agarivorans]
MKIPIQTAGNSAFSWNGKIIIGGGESDRQLKVHHEVIAFNTDSNTWNNWPNLNTGRHGTGFARVANYIYTASGCGNRGGTPELVSIERLKLPEHHSNTYLKVRIPQQFL